MEGGGAGSSSVSAFSLPSNLNSPAAMKTMTQIQFSTGEPFYAPGPVLPASSPEMDWRMRVSDWMFCIR